MLWLHTLISLVLIFSVSNVYAERWVCFNETTTYVKSRHSGDGTALGITDENNSNIRTDCILATESDYQKSGQSYMKVKSGSVIDMTQTEKDAVIASETQTIKDADIANVNSLDILTINLAKALIQLGIVDGDNLKNKIKQIKGLQ